MWIRSIGASGPQTSITPGLVWQGSLDLFQQTEPDSISRSITDCGWCRGIASLRFACSGTLFWAVHHRSQDYLGANSHTPVVKPLHTSAKQRCLHYLGHLVIGKIESFTKETSSITVSGIKLVQDTWYLRWFCQLDTIQNLLRRGSVRGCLDQVILSCTCTSERFFITRKTHSAYRQHHFRC